MYQEMTAVKDQVVVSLTNQVNSNFKLVKSVRTFKFSISSWSVLIDVLAWCIERFWFEKNGESISRSWVLCCRCQLYTLEKSTVEGVEVQEFDEEDDGAIERWGSSSEDTYK